MKVTFRGLNDGPLFGKGSYEACIACNPGTLVKSGEEKKKDKK